MLRLKQEIVSLNKKNERIAEVYEAGVYSLETYSERKVSNEAEISRIQGIIKRVEVEQFQDEQKEKTINAVRKFIDDTLSFPNVNGYKTSVPEVLIETYVNSIKACADNVFEVNIRVNPEAPVQIPIKPDEEFNPQYDSANLFFDNSGSSLIAEFALTYEDARSYTSVMKGKYKVRRIHFEKPITVRVYADL